MIMDSFQNAMMDVFVFETNTFLETLEALLLEGEHAPEKLLSAAPEIFRIMHTLKSSAAMMGLSGISSLAHSMEGLFSHLRGLPPAQVDAVKASDLLLQCVDFIKRYLQTSVQEDAQPLIDTVEKYLQQLQQPVQAYTVRVLFKQPCPMLEIRVFELLHRLQSACQQVTQIPGADAPDYAQQVSKSGLLLQITTAQPLEEVLSFLRASPFVQSAQTEVQEAPAVQSPAPTAGSKFVPVPAEKLDRLVDLAGELWVTQLQLSYACEARQYDKAQQLIEMLLKEVEALQEHSLDLRMVPLKNTLNRLNRVVRDTAKTLGKDVRLVLMGEDTQVDARIADGVFPALLHLVRNAIDHGIELPEQRLAAGKAAQGTLKLSAAMTGRGVTITLRDDGAGIDRNAVKKKAIQNGLISPEQAEKLTAQQIDALVLRPGFSTRNEANELSGRGVGMDAALNSTKSLNGKMMLHNNPGSGLTVELQIPLTTAVMETMLLRSGQELCAIQMSAVKQVLRADEHPLHIVNSQESVIIDELCYPVIRLTDFFGQPRPEDDAGMLLLIDMVERPYVLLTPRVEELQSVVVKPVPPLLRGTKGIQGCTMLGDGQIHLILDPVGLMQSNKGGNL